MERLQGALADIAKQNSISGRRALAQALVWKMARDREEGLALKKGKAMQDNEKGIDIRLECRCFLKEMYEVPISLSRGTPHLLIHGPYLALVAV